MADTKHLCTNCHEAPSFDGWDDCLECGVAVALVEQPDYIEFARRVYADKTEWLARLEAEWARQTFTPTFTEGCLMRRQAS